jgi:hypothetical protein
MRMTTLAITGALVACAAAPASAATNAGSWTPTYNTCEALAMNRGITVSERRSSEIGQSAYRQFMVSCLAGKVEGKPVVTARLAPAEQIPGKWASCEELATSRGVEVNARRGSDSAASPWRQFMASCLAGKIH